ncbi:B3 domain-containing protein Os01g0234100-like [Rosa rugosa]|uniref:B3 domain-containing protein Os01g0234100-like n=1 Tax=Rosa rugosa TaxID=74645 RepID=UPI002B40E198|nr:B3 domain-containing protein Os01g0234100-like [Rosa rugosa]
MAFVKEQKQSSKGFASQNKRARSSNNEQKQTIRNNVINVGSVKSDSEQKKFKRATEESLYETSEAQFSVLERANEVAANLDPQFPSMVKVMLPSHVSGGFWLGLSKTFCIKHLPKQDTMFVLEDENGEKFETKYLVKKIGLSGGWRGFSIAHKLLAGDVLVFHLVTESKFKVYVIRSNGLGEVECALGLVQLDAGIRPVDSENENREPTSVENPDGVIQRNKTAACNSKCGTVSDLFEDDTEDASCEVLEGIKLSESIVPFDEVCGIENFNVIYNGLIINPLFPKPLLTKYYELCCSQNSFLHEHLLEGLNYKLVAGIISETTNIANAIKACKITTLESSVSTWDKTLQAGEMLGMNVSFLREQLEQLASLASKLKRCEEARLEREQEEQEMRTRLAKLLEVKEKKDRLQSRISVKLMSRFKEVIDAPW